MPAITTGVWTLSLDASDATTGADYGVAPLFVVLWRHAAEKGGEKFAIARRPFGDRHRAADQQKVIVWRRPITRHDILIMNAEMVPAELVVLFRRDRLLEIDAPPQRVAAGSAKLFDADAGDRIKIDKAHDVLARLAVDPGHRRRDGEAGDDGAHARCGRMQRDCRHDRAERQKHDWRTAAAELRRPRHDGAGNSASRGMANQRNFVGFAGADSGDQVAGAALDRLIDPGGAAAAEPPERRPGGNDLHDAPAVGERPQRKQRRHA